MLPLPPSGDKPIDFSCPECGQSLSAPARYAGKTWTCTSCRNWVKVPSTPPGAFTEREPDPYGLGERERPRYESQPPAYQPNPGAGGGQIMGWVIFILIFGVGNLILYATTGIFIIPIPRR
jgi:hypothetical protein